MCRTCVQTHVIQLNKINIIQIYNKLVHYLQKLLVTYLFNNFKKISLMLMTDFSTHQLRLHIHSNILGAAYFGLFFKICYYYYYLLILDIKEK